MKSQRKHPAASTSSAPPGPIALTARQAARRKVFLLAKVLGVVAVVAGLIFGANALAGWMFPHKTIKTASGREIDDREPKLNPNTPPGKAPEGMVWVPGGEFYMGFDHEEFLDANEIHLVYVDGFWMDRHEVTNEQFAKFIAATGYVTDAEKQPKREDFVREPLYELKPFSIVFEKPSANKPIDLRDFRAWMKLRYGACWKYPEGPSSTITGREKYPVVHVSHNDAVAYCQWAGKRLATEAEWEFAARGGLDRQAFPWGDELKPEGKWMVNVWQGRFPTDNTKEDGFEGAAPVGSFPPNAYGLYDMSGNVWEWCADWYQADYYRNSPERNPKGPDTGFDFREPGSGSRVQRGGSFLCSDVYCVRYVLGTRGQGEVTSGASHVGFRCVKDAK